MVVQQLINIHHQVIDFVIMACYGSIMMTYFGVNFYLTGLHSYASGDVPVTPSFVWYIVIGAMALSIFGYLGYKKHFTKKGQA